GNGAMQIHAYDQPGALLGQGSVGLEWEEQASGLDTVLVAVGGGGLVGGVAAWYQGKLRIVGVEPAEAPSATRSGRCGNACESRPNRAARRPLRLFYRGSINRPRASAWACSSAAATRRQSISGSN